jgi:hypothetical protein
LVSLNGLARLVISVEIPSKQSEVDLASAIEVGGDMSAAAAALAGRLLVFLGSLSTAVPIKKPSRAQFAVVTNDARGSP